MVLGPEQVTWTTIFHNYLRSSVKNFRGPRSENMSRGSSVVYVTGGHRWCSSPGVNGGAGRRVSTVVHVTGVINDTCYKRSSAVHHNSYYILFFCITFIFGALVKIVLVLLIFLKRNLTIIKIC